MEAAVAAIKNKDWRGALAKLQVAHGKDAKNADVHDLLGYSYRNSGDLERAFTHYRTALELNAQHKSAHEYIGEAYLLVRQPHKAREHPARLKAICGESCEEYQDLAKRSQATSSDSARPTTAGRRTPAPHLETAPLEGRASARLRHSAHGRPTAPCPTQQCRSAAARARTSPARV